MTLWVVSYFWWREVGWGFDAAREKLQTPRQTGMPSTSISRWLVPEIRGSIILLFETIFMCYFPRGTRRALSLGRDSKYFCYLFPYHVAIPMFESCFGEAIWHVGLVIRSIRTGVV